MLIYNVYCDESCHLENDGQKAMVFGAVWSLTDTKNEISQRVNDIRERHGMARDFEFKWTKISPSKTQMYLDLVDYFFDNDDINFRCLVIPNKQLINHGKFNQTHDDWYYKQYFNMLKIVLRPAAQYNIYLDIKDTKSNAKVRKLHDVLCNNAYDFSRQVIHKVQQIRSHEAAQSQIADVLIGAMSYKARELDGNAGKQAIISRIAERSGYSLGRSTLYREEKFNILYWQGEH
ncbi:DUF3800 domain-containing protein [Agrobacterium tumefaciens]|uniref:DUF3800 domain-containing protein n=1 Tax=Agrobacterium tumefaciens TaxID=358 RepID=UPI001572EC93|nr:DUF3800 domain-containing protein [Agrobacterium tumefaciens]NTE33162.1 DUF3800 domain-containing protein [Agrobacterium tumefaciens]NTE48672.1 DUF3800 domain-containing protein [Agrobacterium tumefaciens]